MMFKENQIFEFNDYKAYLLSKLGKKNERKGLRSALARELQCQPTYISQVLNGDASFNLEQADKISAYLGHTQEEKHYFLLLVQLARAGTKSLREYYQHQLKEISEKRLVLTERLGKRTTLPKDAQSVYYSSWIYAACHIALTIPNLQSKQNLAQFFNLPLVKVNQVIEFLIQVGLAEVVGGKIQTQQNSIRVGRDSHNLLKHHMNFRSQAMESLDRESLEDLHYSSVFSLSQKDKLKVKDLLLDLIKSNAELVQASDSEDLCALAIDFFSLKKG